MNKKTFIYARVSTDQQSSGLDAQLLALRQYCAANNIVGYEIFSDENQSGAKVSRPSLDRMMTAVRNNEVDRIITYSLSRLGRSTTHLLKLMDEMNKHEVKFVSLSERLETETPAGRMIFTVLAAVSQLERELIAERVRCGLRAAVARGKILGRKKLRDSDLIRKLIKNGLSYRAIATIAKCSHGSVHAEVLSLRKEEAELKKKTEDEKLALDEAIRKASSKANSAKKEAATEVEPVPLAEEKTPAVEIPAKPIVRWS